jgi:hypothetical protein
VISARARGVSTVPIPLMVPGVQDPHDPDRLDHLLGAHGYLAAPVPARGEPPTELEVPAPFGPNWPGLAVAAELSMGVDARPERSTGGAAGTHDMNNFRSGLFVVAIRVGLVRIRVATLTISISVYTSHGTNSCATLLLALCGRKRFKESRNTPQTIEELSNRQVDDVLERLLACEKGGHTQFEALTV